MNTLTSILDISIEKEKRGKRDREKRRKRKGESLPAV